MIWVKTVGSLDVFKSEKEVRLSGTKTVLCYQKVSIERPRSHVREK